MGENSEFGLGKTPARHFTTYSLRHASADRTAELDSDLPATLGRMNPMPFSEDVTDFIAWIGKTTGYAI